MLASFPARLPTQPARTRDIRTRIFLTLKNCPPPCSSPPAPAITSDAASKSCDLEPISWQYTPIRSPFCKLRTGLFLLDHGCCQPGRQVFTDRLGDRPRLTLDVGRFDRVDKPAKRRKRLRQ